MREVSLFIATSLDGFVARADGALDWLFRDADYGYTPFYAGVDRILIGRRAFEAVLGRGEWPFRGKPTTVFSRTLKKCPVADAAICAADPAAEVRRLKASHGRRIWLFGGPQLAGSLLAANLVDEMVLSIHPIVLGGGIPLFTGGAISRHWKLGATRGYQSGLVQTTYYRAD